MLRRSSSTVCGSRGRLILRKGSSPRPQPRTVVPWFLHEEVLILQREPVLLRLLEESPDIQSAVPQACVGVAEPPHVLPPRQRQPGRLRISGPLLNDAGPV